mmetsp:Transcript_14920/g.37927  ORF Transcript_14920/g.37927 Transcript_14920/m.37927 type:complete len:114 (+) Transcript_14920:436-777(+)
MKLSVSVTLVALLAAVMVDFAAAQAFSSMDLVITGGASPSIIATTDAQVQGNGEAGASIEGVAIGTDGIGFASAESFAFGLDGDVFTFTDADSAVIGSATAGGFATANSWSGR